MTDTILYSRTGHVARLVLNNPARHNALGLVQIEAIRDALAVIAGDTSVRVVILTGAGDSTFCAGAALDELGAGKLSDNAFQAMTGELAALPQPTICALNGNVFGGGVELAASCDFRIGVAGSRMRVPAAALGLCYPLEGIERLVAALGVGVTRRILVAAEEFTSRDMLAIGFLDHLVAPADLDTAASRLAEQIASLAPLAVQSMKHLLRQAAAGRIDAQEARELAAKCLASADLQEGLAAQRAKRPPRFTGE